MNEQYANKPRHCFSHGLNYIKLQNLKWLHVHFNSEKGIIHHQKQDSEISKITKFGCESVENVAL